MAHICIVGAVGSGKSVVAQRFIDEALMRDPDVELPDGRLAPHFSEHIHSTIPLEGHDLPVEVVDRSSLYTTHCGVTFVDELQLHLGARDWEKMSEAAKDWWTRHRHYDETAISTTQHPSFIDKIARILTNAVWLCSRLSLPLLGWLMPRSVRPPDWCSCHVCKGVQHRPELQYFYRQRYGHEEGTKLYTKLQTKWQRHARRDALGDRHTWWQKAFGFGTLFVLRRYDVSTLGALESLDPENLDNTIIPKEFRFMLFDMKWAARSRASVAARRAQPPAATPPVATAALL